MQLRPLAESVLYVGHNLVQQALLPLTPMLAEELAQTQELFESFDFEGIVMLARQDQHDMLFGETKTALACHWKPAQKWWKAEVICLSITNYNLHYF